MTPTVLKLLHLHIIRAKTLGCDVTVANRCNVVRRSLARSVLACLRWWDDLDFDLVSWVCVSCWTESHRFSRVGRHQFHQHRANDSAGESLEWLDWWMSGAFLHSLLRPTNGLRDVSEKSTRSHQRWTLKTVPSSVSLSNLMSCPCGEVTQLRHASIQQQFDCIDEPRGELIPWRDGAARRPHQLQTRTLMRVWTGST